MNFHSIFIFYFFQGPPPLPRLYCSSCTPPLMFRFASTRLLLPRAETHFDRLAGSPVYVTARLPAVEGNRSFFIRRESGTAAAQLWQEMDCGASSLTAAGGRWIGRSVKGEPGATWHPGTYGSIYTRPLNVIRAQICFFFFIILERVQSNLTFWDGAISCF